MHAHFDIPVPKTDIKERLVWTYSKADWEGVRSRVEDTDWENCICNADAGAESITRETLRAAEMFIPRRMLKKRKSTHPWVNDRIVELVRLKQNAAGTEGAGLAMETCSAGIRTEF